jgi:hypothetical protein
LPGVSLVFDDSDSADNSDSTSTGESDDDRHDSGDSGRFPDTSRFPDYGYDEDDVGEDEDDGEGDGGGPGSGPSGKPGSPAGQAPLPALTNITISAGTLLGWSDAPAEAAGFGLLDPGSARDLIAAASRHPRSRWCVTLLDGNGEAIAHGCASGQHPWTPVNPRDGTTRAGPDDHQRAQLAGLLSQLGMTLAPIAKGECDHRHQEDRYRPSRKLHRLIRARTATCSASGCTARAIYCEIDHTTAHPQRPLAHYQAHQIRRITPNRCHGHDTPHPNVISKQL